jgi:hypothetical protein
MPALHVIRQTNQNAQMRAQTRMKGYSEDIHKAAHAADQVRQESTVGEDELALLEGHNTEFVSFTARQTSQQYLAMILLVAVYVIDTLLFGGVATLLAKSAFPGNPVMLYVVKIGVPMVFVGIEVYLSWLIYETRRKAAENTARRHAVNPWLFVGVIFALVMPVLVISSLTDTFRIFTAGDSLAKLLTARLIALTLAAFIVHSVVIFSGRFAVEAKAYFLYRSRHRRLRSLIQDRNRSFDLHCQSLVNSFNGYALDRETHFRQFPQVKISQLNLDSVTRELIRECMTGVATAADESELPLENLRDQGDPHSNGSGAVYPSEVDEAGPAVANSAMRSNTIPFPPRAQSPTPAVEDRDESLQAENEHLRQILTQRIRNADDEVQ